MRLLIMLLLMAPAPLSSQSVDPHHVQEEPIALEEQEPPLADESARTGAKIFEYVESVRAVKAAPASSSAAQPTMGGFLYQVFLAAVTALVTALIWKAVF